LSKEDLGVLSCHVLATSLFFFSERGFKQLFQTTFLCEQHGLALCSLSWVIPTLFVVSFVAGFSASALGAIPGWIKCCGPKQGLLGTFLPLVAVVDASCPKD